MRTVLRLLPGVLLLAACTDTPVSLPESPPPFDAVVPTPGVPCTVRWAAAVNGSWFDVARWTPAGVPAAGASVCIDVAGTYTVTMDPSNDSTPIPIAALDLGATGASPTLLMTGTGAILQVAQGLMIRSGATMTMNNFTASAVTVGGVVTNRGTLQALAACGSCGQLHTLSADVLNEGTWTMGGILTLTKAGGAYQNLGTINFGNNGQMVIPAGAGAAAFDQDGGAITAAGNFTTLTMRSGTFTMNGGKARSRNGASNLKPIVVLDGANLVLQPTASDSAALGVLGSAAGARTVTGDIPALTALWLGGPTDGQPGSVNLAGNPTNAGRIMPLKNLEGTGGALTIAGAGRLTNNGTIAQSQSAGSQAVFRYTIEFTNNGTISVTDGTHIELAKPGVTYQNNGSIGMGALSSTVELRLAANTFVNGTAGSTSGGTIVVDTGARVMGGGVIGSAIRTQNGGVVEPGLSPGLLTTAAYVPMATGRLRIELGGLAPTAEYDQLNVTTNMILAQSTLDLVEINGFQSGLCGQVFEIVKHTMATPNNSWGPFGTVNGLSPGTGRQIRVIYRTQTTQVSGAVLLVGFDGSKKICVGPDAVAVTEGGATATYAVTLAQAPTLQVVVTPTPNAQVTVSPSSLTFTSANWQVPQFVTVTAVDDQAQEGNHTGSITHAVTTSDGFYQGTALGTVTANITDNDVNRAPVAVNDNGSTAEDTPVDLSVRSNDSDPDGDAVTVTAVTTPGHGTATVINGGAAVRYAPAANYNGSDAFNYTISDGKGGSASASVAVNITASPDAPIAVNDTAMTVTPNPVTVSVLSNDSEPDGQPLTVVSVTQPSSGAAEVTPGDLGVTYRPNPAFAGGSVSFNYTISDGSGGTATATVTVQVLGPNHDPVANPDFYSVVSRNGGLFFIDVLANDTDADGDALSIVSVTQGSAGDVSIDGGRVVYVQNLPRSTDRFTYTVSDGRGGQAVGTVEITSSADIVLTDVNVVLERAEAGYAAFRVRETFSGFSQVPPTYNMVVELPEGTFTAGTTGTMTPTSAAFSPPPGCTIDYFPGTSVIQRYRCFIDNHPAFTSLPVAGPMFLFAVDTAAKKNLKLRVTLLPANYIDSDLKNNTMDVKIRMP